MNWEDKLKDMHGWSFGNTPEMADQLGQLVLEGKKTATSSLYQSYTEANEPLPQVGSISYIKNSKGEPLCVIEVMKVEVQTFSSVSADFAFLEGEGDRSLEYWRKEHIRFFSQYCEFQEDMKVVCETFRVLHRF